LLVLLNVENAMPIMLPSRQSRKWSAKTWMEHYIMT
jgi:hypothetical protein